MKLLLDANILGPLCHPARKGNEPLSEWLERVLCSRSWRVSVCIPAIAEYEVRRGLLHVALRSGRATTRSLERLDLLVETLDYLPISPWALREAARLWAKSRHEGQATATPEALDGDVLLAAQAREVSGVVVTENVRHLSRFVTAYRWREVVLGL